MATLRLILINFFITSSAIAQVDSLPVKISHAEPLYSDLVRDLGARKGEHEWNIGAGFSKNRQQEVFSSLIEYEFAPVNRLGFEIEVPFAFTSGWRDSIKTNQESRIEGLKLATQYTFLVRPEWQTSMAIGYTHEFEFIPIQAYSSENMFHGNDFRPFVVIAKRWGERFHSTIITGPEWETHKAEALQSAFNLDVSAFYMLPEGGHFIGLEVNNHWLSGKAASVLRPQMRLKLSSTVKLGLVAEIPLTADAHVGAFCRLIYEPRKQLFQK